ncbi:MAG TPA: LLM class flavin-dependent oxidoreductase [Candidatus Limnocylindrales bacterium]|nr:LLM class flavin-dependent oxidoreductase [Candidatus Limnocylindrales bacterium]
MSLAPRFGLFMSQAGKPWSQVREEFRLADELGFDTAWLVDHLVDTDGPPEHPCLEAWTLLGALAMATTRIRLGVLVSSNTFRHPSLLLKEAVTVDHVSGGRLILGIGTGWHEDEHRRYGFDLPANAERVDRFAEAVEIAVRLQEEPRLTFTGRHYRLEDAVFEPRPLQVPHIPLLIAAHRPRMLRLAGRWADQWDTFPELPGAATEGITTSIADRLAVVEQAARDAGRDPATIRRSTWGGPETLESVEAYEAFVRHHLELGFTDVCVVPRGIPGERLRRIAAEVLPRLRAEHARADEA